MCFDWLFNRQIPESNEVFVVARPASKTWVNGLAQTYSEEFDSKRLQEHISQKEYVQIMERINDILINYFPCPLSWYCGYFCCLFTLGLSLLCPLICINDAEGNLREFIDRVKGRKLKEKKTRLVLRKRCGTSWLEWHLPAEIRAEANAYEGGSEKVVPTSDSALLC